MANPGDETTDSAQTGAKQEALIFAKIVRYLAEQAVPASDGTDEPSNPLEPENTIGDETVQLFIEIAEAFEATRGFEFAPDQAGPLAGVFGTLTVGMRGLADQARQSGHDNAAAKMEWAAGKSRHFTAHLEQCHLDGKDGVVAFLNDSEGEA